MSVHPPRTRPFGDMDGKAERWRRRAAEAVTPREREVFSRLAREYAALASREQKEALGSTPSILPPGKQSAA